GDAHGGRHARPWSPAPPHPPPGREVRHLRGRLRPDRGLRAIQRPLLRLRAALRDVRRRGRVHLPVVGAPRDPRLVRPSRAVRVHRAAPPRPRLRVAQGVAPVGLVEKGLLPKPLTWLLNYSRKYSLWMFQWGLACCAIEMGAALASPRYDVM